MATRTLDRDASAFYASEQLGENQSLTPEGFLLCKGVRVARLGTMLYTQDDLPHLTPGQDGYIRAGRAAEDLFHPETMASFEGKPVTDDHPEDDVKPHNWSQYAKGTMHNVRRGAGIDDQYMIADLLITEEKSIAAVRDGKREVSLGYDADYEQLQPGHARQHTIIGNHVALVDRGRCGPRCAIQDKETTTMTKPTAIERLKQAFGTRDAKAFDEAAAELGQESGAPVINIHTAEKTKDADTALEARMTKMEDSLASIAKALTNDKKSKDEDGDEEDEEKKKKTEDADEDEDEDEKKKKTEDDFLEEDGDDGKTMDAATAYADVVSRAEILAPGYKLPTLTKDAKATKKGTRDGICACQRRALNAAMKTEDGKKAVSKFLRGRTVDSLSKSAVDSVFVAASELMRESNNVRTKVKDADAVKTIDAFEKNGINNINKNFWGNLNK